MMATLFYLFVSMAALPVLFSAAVAIWLSRSIDGRVVAWWWARFFYLQHHAFAGKVSGQSFGTATTAPSVNLLRIEESLSAAHLRMASGTTIENQRWYDCLARYDRPHTFFYADPPYWWSQTMSRW